MYKFHTALAALTMSLSIAGAASAATYTFDFSGDSLFGNRTIEGSGVFETSDTAMMVGGRTAYAVIGVTGEVNGSSIVAPLGFYGNYFTTGPAFLDGSGLRFFTEGGLDVRFFYQDTVSRYRVNTFGNGGGFTGFVDASSMDAAPGETPIPGALPLFLSGLGALGLATYRRKRKQAAR